jgi:hypothetical protein
MPTLGEFIERAKRQGRDATPFVVLPDLRQDRRLEHETVENWCKTLGLPGEDFGLGSSS